MTDEEYADVMTLITSEFETLGGKLERRGLLSKEWALALKLLDKALVMRTLRRWVHRFNTEPSLDRFMQLAEEVREEGIKASRHRQGGGASMAADLAEKTLALMAKREVSEDDALWGLLHTRVLTKIVGRSQQEREDIMVGHYRQWMDEYPQLRGDCMAALEYLEGKDPQPTQTGLPIPDMVGAPAAEAYDDDAPF